MTGKGLNWSGSLIRPEATGYGCVYFAAEMLRTRNQTLEGKTCLVSGSGNVSQYTIEKVLELGGKVVTVSDSNGYIYDEDAGDPDNNIKPGMKFSKLPDNWTCPVCGAGKEEFVMQK